MTSTDSLLVSGSIREKTENTTAELLNIADDSACMRKNEGLIGRVQRYWSCRANAFGRVRRDELHGDKMYLWKNEIIPYFPKAEHGKPLRVLDIGTGAGFFAVALALESMCETVGIDLCPDMLDEARALAREAGCGGNTRFLQMDATQLAFENNSFDCLVARNVTWTLIDPRGAYAEWMRVLRPGGVMLNFDADYGGVDFVSLSNVEGGHAHADIDRALLIEGEEIKQCMPLGREKRPAWDIECLNELGFRDIAYDTEISGRIFATRDSSYNPVPMFALRAVK